MGAELHNHASSQILVVEDEAEIRELVSLLLLRQGHQVQQCSSAVEALERVRTKNYDVIILDWMLPNMSGVDFLKALPESLKSRTPVLMVTAKSEPADIVEGLDAGADDYVTKPFEPSVLLARVKSLLRRSKSLPGVSSDAAAPSVSGENQEVMAIGELIINLAAYSVKCCGEDIHLTPSEFKLLATMAQNQGRVMTRDFLIGVVQGEGISVVGRTIDTHVFGLRKKLASCSDWIETIRGVGYRIKSEI